MAKFKNTQQIDEIEMSRTIQLFCPLGNAPYNANCSIDFCPSEDGYIPDYVDVTNFLDNMRDQSLIIEDAICKVLNYLVEEYDPEYVCVKIYAESAVHLPVTVSKAYDKEIKI